jgi:hypothetical protein
MNGATIKIRNNCENINFFPLSRLTGVGEG